MSLLLDSLFSSIALSHLMVDVFNSARPVLLTYLGLSESRIALISTVYIWVASMTQPFFGWASDRIGPRWLAAGGVLWMTIFFTGAVYVPGTGGLICLIIAALKGFEGVGWLGLMAPAQTRPDVVARLNQEVTEILRSESMARFIGDRGSIAAPSTGAEFDRFIQTEIVRWGDAVRRSGATAQ